MRVRFCTRPWAMAFGLGKVTKTGTAPNFTYTCTPLNPSAILGRKLTLTPPLPGTASFGRSTERRYSFSS